MPLHWSFDSRARLVVAVANGLVTRDEMEAFLTTMAGAGALPWRKLFDGRRGDTAMELGDFLEIAVRIRSFHVQPVGPLAVVLPMDKFELLSRVLGVLAAADRPMRLFEDLRPARRWIDSFAPSETALDSRAGSAGPRTGRRADKGTNS